MRVTISNCFAHFVIHIYGNDGKCIRENNVIILKDFKFDSYVIFIKDPGITTRYYPLFKFYYSGIDVNIDYEQFDNTIPMGDYIKEHMMH